MYKALFPQLLVVSGKIWGFIHLIPALQSQAAFSTTVILLILQIMISQEQIMVIAYS